MKKKTRNVRPNDGYEIANSANLFLDLKPRDNEREEYLNDKVRSYLQSIGMMTETKLPDVFYKQLEQAVMNSSFWLEDNDFDNADFETYQGENALQTDAARSLNLALQDYFLQNQIPIIAVVESVDPSANKLAVIGPDHKYYPNRIILGGEQALSSKNQIVILLHLATFSEDFNTDDIDEGAVSRVVSRVVRHEAIHGIQLDKRKKNQKVSRRTAKKSFEKEGQIPQKGSSRTKYLKSHIEVDAYAHEIAEELYDLLGYDEAIKALTDKKKINNLDLSDQVKEYLYDHAGSKFTKRLIGKIYKHLNDFKDRNVLESKVLRKIIAEALTSYDVEDVYSTARLAHLGQMRRDGKEYFTHPREVAKIVRKYYPNDTRAYLVALLHDTIEDTEEVGNLSVKELTTMIDASIGDPKEAQDIINAVNALTHAKNQPYVEYVQSLTSNPLALKVKLADMMHNLGSTPTERQKLKYEKAISTLSQKHSGNIPGVSTDHVRDLLKMTESKSHNVISNSAGEKLIRSLVRSTLSENVQPILIPPPPPVSERIKELSLITIQKNNPKNQDEMQGALDKKVAGLFNAVLKSAGYRGYKPYIKKLKNEIIPVIKYHKLFFRAPRPNELASTVGLSFDYDYLETAQSHSYPSGHAAQAYYIAHNLSKDFPQLTNKLYEIAEMIASSRIDRGVHFPSDIEGGKFLADRLMTLKDKKRK